jgi:cycloeucalenol cycloisomerase
VRPVIALSTHPAKRRVERWWLLYTPIWGVAVGTVMLTGLAERWGDRELLPFSIVLALGAMAPAMKLERTAIKMCAAVFAFAMLMNYFCTPYFFEVLGMHYGFKTTIAIQNNPLFLYFMTVPYFATYSALITIGHRTARRIEGPLRYFAIAAIPLALAALETALNANPFMTRLFWFDDLGFMLTYGTLSYGVALACSMPVYLAIDEDPSHPRPMHRVAIDVLAAMMAIVIAFELLRPALLSVRAS